MEASEPQRGQADSRTPGATEAEAGGRVARATMSELSRLGIDGFVPSSSFDAAVRGTGSCGMEGYMSALLNADLRDAAAKPSLPAWAASAPPTRDILRGRHFLQVDELVNAGSNLKERYAPQQVGRSRCLKLMLTDGHLQIAGFELRPVPDIRVDMPAGAKLVVVDCEVRFGMLCLTPENTVVLGGCVDSFDAARRHLLDRWTAPARGAARNRGGHIEGVKAAVLGAAVNTGTQLHDVTNGHQRVSASSGLVSTTGGINGDNGAPLRSAPGNTAAGNSHSAVPARGYAVPEAFGIRDDRMNSNAGVSGRSSGDQSRRDGRVPYGDRFDGNAAARDPLGQHSNSIADSQRPGGLVGPSDRQHGDTVEQRLQPLLSESAVGASSMHNIVFVRQLDTLSPGTYAVKAATLSIRFMYTDKATKKVLEEYAAHISLQDGTAAHHAKVSQHLIQSLVGEGLTPLRFGNILAGAEGAEAKQHLESHMKGKSGVLKRLQTFDGLVIVRITSCTGDTDVSVGRGTANLEILQMFDVVPLEYANKLLQMALVRD